MSLYKYPIVLLSVVILLLSSCTSRKKILYFSDIAKDSANVFNNYPTEAHKIVSGDLLYINFYSFNKPLSEIFNRQQTVTNSYSMWNSPANVYVNSFSVNDSGSVLLPLIGLVKVSDLSIDEATKTIQNKAKNYVNDVTVTIKLLNYRYTVLGEVNHPGTYINYNDDLTIFQAVANAGDASIYGNKTKTTIIRETKDGKKVIRFDFTDIKVLSSEAYYIKPNDIIYIEPVRNKSFKQNLPNIALLFSSITTTILVLNYIDK